ncbi:FtsB family cell division protein [Vagococcus vulneris]|uniref:Septum formation initiator n=1 Tax=Vagococcus vulneris TaxID=1977869 RepID=A0A429ZSV2_9ENTE|nr:septum formation initiator family protein [Vagococcus vulneris]RST96756.1 hypothetical protein CBF37_10670 [Vagococcus vulneris]
MKKQKLLTNKKDEKLDLAVQPLSELTTSTNGMLFKRRRLAIMFVIAFAVFTIIGFNLFKNSQRLLSLQDTKVEVVKENEKVMDNKEDLEHEVNLLHDSDYVAKIARSKYFYSKEGEQVYSIPELNSSNQTSGNK